MLELGQELLTECYKIVSTKELEIRISLHIGPVLGISLTSKHASSGYFFFGQTMSTLHELVETASNGQIQISQKMFGMVKQKFSNFTRNQEILTDEGVGTMFHT